MYRVILCSTRGEWGTGGVGGGKWKSKTEKQLNEMVKETNK